MRLDKDWASFVKHKDWYTIALEDDGVYSYRPTNKAPGFAVEAMNRYNSKKRERLNAGYCD